MKKTDKFIWRPGEATISLCMTCKHLKSGAVCAAFPDGIPLVIRTNDRDHRKSFPGDHGIRFEPIEGDDD